MARATTWCAGAVCASVWCVAPWCVGQTLPPPSAATAAPPSTSAAVPSSPGLTPSQVRPANRPSLPSVPAGERDPHQGRRVLSMSLAGAAGALGGTLVGGLLGEEVSRLSGSDSWTPIYLGVTVGHLAGVSLGVTLAGYAQGGNGGYGWVLLGGGGGALALGSLGMASEDVGVFVALVYVGSVAGAVVAYELSNDPQRRPRAGVSARVLPTLTADATGLRLGLGGTF